MKERDREREKENEKERATHLETKIKSGVENSEMYIVLRKSEIT